VPEIVVLLAAGVVAVAVREAVDRPAVGGLVGVVPVAAVAATTASIPAIFLTFLKIGAVLFGSGYVLVALLRSELVEGLGWLTEAQLLDAVAVGQATPGPLFSTATFIGYVVGGPAGAAAATVGVFLPAFLAVAISIPILDRLRASSRARAFLDGVNVAAVALIAIVAVQLASGSFPDLVSIAIGVVALVGLLRGIGSGWLMAAGALVGLSRLVLTLP
jgi:chromate transporter